MKLLTKKNLNDLRKQDPYDPSGPQRELKPEETKVLVKFFTPDANWTWYAISASPDPETGDVQFFGLVQGLATEYGYFWLSELKKIKGPLGLNVERDKWFTPVPLNDLTKKLRTEGAMT